MQQPGRADREATLVVREERVSLFLAFFANNLIKT